jgi:hypothetical protein
MESRERRIPASATSETIEIEDACRQVLNACARIIAHDAGRDARDRFIEAQQRALIDLKNT